MNPLLRIFPLMILAGLSSLLGNAQELLPPITEGQRVFTCGHSFHIFTYQQVDEIAKSAGLKHRLAGLSGIGGSTVSKHWSIPDETNKAKAALSTGKVDVLTLAPIWLPDEGIAEFVKFGLQHNPDLRITVQEFWMPNDEYEPIYPLQTRKPVDHNTTDLTKLRAATLRYAQDIEVLVQNINQEIGKPSVLVVPVGLAAVTLREKIVKGEIPAIKTQAELFHDSWGHPTAPLQVLSSYCHFSVIYRRNPAGLPAPKALQSWNDLSEQEISTLNRQLQEIAWDAVSQHPMAGMMK